MHDILLHLKRKRIFSRTSASADYPTKKSKYDYKTTNRCTINIYHLLLIILTIHCNVLNKQYNVLSKLACCVSCGAREIRSS